VRIGPEEATPSEARLARALEPAIHAAMEAGWDPETRGRAFRYTVAESL
jgi:hypothetical protein